MPPDLLASFLGPLPPAPPPGLAPSPIAVTAPRPSAAALPAVAPPRRGSSGPGPAVSAGPVAAPAPLSPALVAPVALPDAEVRLEYGEDGRGRFAVYRLRPGEALYSSVVVRLTGRLHADDVNALAVEIAARSGIADVTAIPIGFEVKVPLDLLLPEFLPPGDSRRLEWEVEQRLTGRIKNEVKAAGLEGITVILDAGHGGADIGASMAGAWESLNVYDITLRVQRLLKTGTLASVFTTTRDGAGYDIPDVDELPYSRGHAVLTTPPYAIGDATIGVHLRWYLANSIFRRATAGSPRAASKVVFVSIHADSLHPSLRGATVYIPDAAETGGAFGKSGSVFDSRKEYREQPRVSFSLGERQRSEGLSRDLGQRIVASFRERDLAVHPFKPVRELIFRGRRAWVPAVLRYNAVPAKILLEVCNLNNPEDRRLLRTREFRQRVAEAVVRGLRSYFGANGAG